MTPPGNFPRIDIGRDIRSWIHQHGSVYTPPQCFWSCELHGSHFLHGGALRPSGPQADANWPTAAQHHLNSEIRRPGFATNQSSGLLKLPIHSQPKLDLPRSGVRTSDEPSGRKRGLGTGASGKHSGSGSGKIGAVENVEEFGSKLYLPCFTQESQGGIFHDRKIQICNPRSCQDIPPRIA